MKRTLIATAAAFGLALTATAATAADYGKREFKVVGTWGNLDQWKKFESTFWNETLPEVTDGALTANAKPYTELGLSGFEVVRLLKLGVYDVVHGLSGYTSQDSPAMEGVDLAAIAPDVPTFEKVLNAYRPILARELDDKYNAKMMALYYWPSQQLFCNLGNKSKENVTLEDLKGKKIRTYSTTLGDFIEGVGGSAVTIAFAEVVPALQKGVADCGVTGTLPAYSAKWYQVVTHNLRVRLGYTSTYVAMNNDTWAGLTPDAQALFDEQMPKWEETTWKATAESDEVGMQCGASGPCPYGDPGGMIPVELSEEENAQLKQMVEEYVLKRWAERCGTQECVDEWNETVGEIVGLKAEL